MNIRRILWTLAIIWAAGAVGAVCRAADAGPANRAAAAGICDPSLAVTPAAVMSGLKAKKIFLIDVRAPADYDQYRIPGALNIPLHAIKTKAFLKAKPVVLVNDGFAVSALAETCGMLNRSGYKAGILAGGILAWKQTRGEMTGDPFAMRRINRISPRLLDREKRDARLVIVHAGETANAPSGQLTPHTRSLSLLKGRKGIEGLKKIIKSEAADPFARIVIYTATGKENDRLQRKLDPEGLRGLYYLEGGRQAYEKHLQYLQLAARSKRERKVTTGGCNSCNQDN